MRIHFIAIGGSAMHNLAIALHLKGEEISGSDDEIFDPAKSRLARYGLLPDRIGWNPDRIDHSLDAVILGMHAREDNPELLKAKSLGLKIYSYPEYIYEQCRNKLRIVVGGSHGKTTITSMILHVFRELDIDCDYMVGAQLDGFEVMVKLSDCARIAVIEGDEYLTSPIDRRPKFHLYKPDIGIISGIAWDHINVFPTFGIYVEQFRIFAEMVPEKGTLIYNEDDEVLREVCEAVTGPEKAPYTIPPYYIERGKTFLKTACGDYPLLVFGKHNLANLNAARLACMAAGIKEQDFYRAMTSFKGASKRLELIAENERLAVYKDFAHSPSKVKATIEAVREQYPDKKLVACLELHTFSSLTEKFLEEYRGSMDQADTALIYFNEKAIEHKKLPPLTPDIIYRTFGNDQLEVFNESDQLVDRILSLGSVPSVFLFMSSGNFNGVNLNNLVNKFVLLQP